MHVRLEACSDDIRLREVLSGIRSGELEAFIQPRDPSVVHLVGLPGVTLRPRHQPGEMMWARETWAAGRECDGMKPSEISRGANIWYGGEVGKKPKKWGYQYEGVSRPSIHMPRWACRYERPLLRVWFEMLHDISEEDAIAEGVTCWVCDGPVDGTSENDCACFHTKANAVPSFEAVWFAIHGNTDNVPVICYEWEA